jgi:hypothetical protein
MLPVSYEGRTLAEDDMKPGWQHVKEAITTDQKNLTEDDHIHEEEKQELKSSEKKGEGYIPKKGAKFFTGDKK